jgi:hypothetical protein
MIEATMWFGLGFLLACLLALIFAPYVHERAVRLTTRRMLATAPLSMAEMQAQKDHLRAEFALSTQRLERCVENLKAKATCQLTEIANRTVTINRLKVELDKKSAMILALQAREQVRKSITRRVVKLLLFAFVQSHRQKKRSMAEMQAQKDHLRAEFAISTQRLERCVENLKAKATCQLTEIANRTATINLLKVELDKKSATILALQAREQVRKSITRRVVKLLLFVFVRSHRQQQRATSVAINMPSQKVTLRNITAERSPTLTDPSNKLYAVHTETRFRRLPKPRPRLPHQLRHTR